MSFYLRIKLNDIFRSIKLSEADFEQTKENQITTIITKALEIHGVESGSILCVDLIDQYKTPIDEENIDMVMQFKGCSHFFIEICVDYQHTDLCILIECFENYLKSNNGEYILSEQKKLNRLKPKTENSLIRMMTQFTFDRFTLYPTETQAILVCKAALSLFDGLKGGLAGLYDGKTKKGAFYNTILNQRRKYKNTAEVSFNQNSVIELSDEEKEAAKLCLKTCVLPRDKKYLKEKLIEFKAFRNEMITQDLDEYKQIWDFYFVCTDLVTFDFELMFEHIEPNSFINKWPKVQTIPYVDRNIRIDEKTFPMVKKNGDIHDFLTFFKLVPTHKTKFGVVVDSFIVYSDNPNEDPVEMIISNNHHPQFLIIASQESDEMKYYIVVEKRILSLPKDYSFVCAVDFFIKLHKLFRLEYHPKIKTLMFFIEYFVYGIEEAKNMFAKKFYDIGQSIFKEENDESNK